MTVYNIMGVDIPGYPPSVDARLPITPSRFLSGVLPAFLVHYLTAVLVCRPNTRALRLTLLPISLPLAWIAATRYDMAAGKDEYSHMNYGICVLMFGTTMRNFEWAFVKEPLRRSDGASGGALLDALNLFFNLRGLGWVWSKGLYFRQVNPQSTGARFIIRAFLTSVKDLLLFDTMHYIVQMMSPDGFGSVGGSIYDPSLPPLQRYARSTAISLLSGLVIYLNLEAMYSIATFIAFCVPFGRRNPQRWPPLTDRPWLATSLMEFWGKRWHQSFRQPFIQLGAKPLARVLGRPGGVMGVFILSEILHDVNMWGLGRGVAWPGFFVAMGAGIVLEGVWTKVTGKKVGGLVGWAWTMGWVIGWSNRLMEAWLVRGLAGKELMPQHLRPGKYLVNKLLGVHQ